jgi:hypothetical protein
MRGERRSVAQVDEALRLVFGCVCQRVRHSRNTYHQRRVAAWPSRGLVDAISVMRFSQISSGDRSIDRYDKACASIRSRRRDAGRLGSADAAARERCRLDTARPAVDVQSARHAVPHPRH